MDKSIRRYASLGAMKAAEYRDWQSLPARVRIQAVADITLAVYRMTRGMTDVPRLRRTLVRLQRPRSQVSDRRGLGWLRNVFVREKPQRRHALIFSSATYSSSRIISEANAKTA
jgi:hypothetical protein